MNGIKYSVFTKPWKDISLEELASYVARMGFDAVEYPLREGYQVQPSDGERGVKHLCETFRAQGIEVASIAGGVDVQVTNNTTDVLGIDERLFAGCSDNGIPVIRICQSMDKSLDFHKNIEIIKSKYDRLIPYCEKYNVKIGVQMHCGYQISNSAETYILLKDYDPKYIAAVWDSGHSGLAGNEPEAAIDTVWDMLCMVNFKAAFRRRTNGPEMVPAQWTVHWTTGKNACGSWKRAVDHLKKRDYSGIVCLPAEYSDEDNVDNYIKQDIAFIKELFE